MAEVKPEFYDEYTETGGTTFTCPTCEKVRESHEKIYLFTNYDYCPGCGAKLNWKGVTWTEEVEEVKCITHKIEVVHKARGV